MTAGLGYTHTERQRQWQQQRQIESIWMHCDAGTILKRHHRLALLPLSLTLTFGVLTR